MPPRMPMNHLAWLAQSGMHGVGLPRLLKVDSNLMMDQCLLKEANMDAWLDTSTQIELLASLLKADCPLAAASLMTRSLPPGLESFTPKKAKDLPGFGKILGLKIRKKWNITGTLSMTPCEKT